jgi:hypothetical protein
LSNQRDYPGVPPDQAPFLPGQTLFFIGDHTSRDDPGYLQVIQGVLDRFHPALHLRLVSVGARGQTASALSSRSLLDILASSKPDWLIIGIGRADALAEPAAQRLLREDAERMANRQEGLEEAFGPELQPGIDSTRTVADSGPEPDLELARLSRFEQDLGAAVHALIVAGVRPVLLTMVTLGHDREVRVNLVLRAYNRAIRDVARASGAPLVDVEHAFRTIFDRAANYKQTVALAAPEGKLNAQGQTLIARTFLDALGLLPGKGPRPLR